MWKIWLQRCEVCLLLPPVVNGAAAWLPAMCLGAWQYQQQRGLAYRAAFAELDELATLLCAGLSVTTQRHCYDCRCRLGLLACIAVQAQCVSQRLCQLLVLLPPHLAPVVGCRLMLSVLCLVCLQGGDDDELLSPAASTECSHGTLATVSCIAFKRGWLHVGPGYVHSLMLTCLV